MTNTENIRWKQRFQNFEKAFLLLKEIVESRDYLSEYEAIVQEGIVQRFEYTFELIWKTLKDKMEIVLKEYRLSMFLRMLIRVNT